MIRGGVGALMLAAACTLPAAAQRVDWETPSGNPGAMRWSSLADVDRANVGRLRVAWTWKTGEHAIAAIRDTMYLSTPYAAVAALNARTGKELWRYDPVEVYGELAHCAGRVGLRRHQVRERRNVRLEHHP
ncbi:MAG: hypothetical protein ACJ8AD_17570 [Gemmatimonadaceae bacterium]